MKKTIYQIGFTLIIIVLFFLSPAFIDNMQKWISKNSNPKEPHITIDYLVSKVDYLLDGNGEDEYPSFYGGMYISDNQKFLVIQVVKDKIPYKNQQMTKEETKEYENYQELINLNSSIKFEYVNNSYNDLEKVRGKIEKILGEYDSHDMCYKITISSYGINIYKNKVIVGFKENTKENQDAFKEDILDSPLIDFEESNPVTA